MSCTSSKKLYSLIKTYFMSSIARSGKNTFKNLEKKTETGSLKSPPTSGQPMGPQTEKIINGSQRSDKSYVLVHFVLRPESHI